MHLKLLPIDRHFADLPRLFAINDEAFPDDERIPSAQLLDILELYKCKAFAFYDEDRGRDGSMGGNTNGSIDGVTNGGDSIGSGFSIGGENANKAIAGNNGGNAIDGESWRNATGGEKNATGGSAAGRIHPFMVGFTTVMYYEPLRMGYIWYFAMASDCRNMGYGSACMKLLQRHFEGTQLVLDMEQVVPSAKNYTQRVRRLNFYERNGYLRTMVGITYFGMHLELMCWPRPFRQDDFRKLLDIARDGKFDPEMYPLSIG